MVVQYLKARLAFTKVAAYLGRIIGQQLTMETGFPGTHG
jgi:hypothetical protein